MKCDENTSMVTLKYVRRLSSNQWSLAYVILESYNKYRDAT